MKCSKGEDIVLGWRDLIEERAIVPEGWHNAIEIAEMTGQNADYIRHRLSKRRQAGEIQGIRCTVDGISSWYYPEGGK